MCYAAKFKVISYINEGQFGDYGFVRVFDTNHNGKPEILFFTNKSVGNSYNVAYEYQAMNQYVLLDTLAYYYYGLFWAVGNIDADSLTDIIVQKNTADSITVFESPAYDSCPTNKVWGGSIKTIAVAPSYITDLDKDGKKEIFTSNIDAESIFVFECSGDNQYDLVYTNNVTGFGEIVYTFAFDDFDRDSLMEFVTGGAIGQVILWECTGPDQYQVVWSDTVEPAYSAYDVVSAKDMDRDGKPEFIIGATRFASFNHTTVWTFYESNGPNSYIPVFVDSLTNIDGSDYYSASYCGDIDNDSIPEAALAVGSNWVVYKATGDNQFSRIYKAYAGDNNRSNTSICIADMNGNGYAEIIESGAINSTVSETKIWEIMGEVTWDSLTATSKDSCIQVKWSTAKQFANYGFNLWRAVGADSNYSVIYQTNDTVRLDTLKRYYTRNDSNVVTGTVYYYKVQAKTLNDSTLFFGPVWATGVEGRPELPITNYEFKIYQNTPNPFSHTTTIKYQIPKSGMVNLTVYNIAGQKVKELVNGNQPAGSYSIVWNKQDQGGRPVSNGVYFYKLVAGDKQAIKKMIMIR